MAHDRWRENESVSILKLYTDLFVVSRSFLRVIKESKKYDDAQFGRCVHSRRNARGG